MKIVRAGALGLCIAALAACATYAPDGAKLPDAPRFLFWSAQEQPLGYRFIERIFPTRIVKRGDKVSPLPLHLMKYDVRYKYKGEIWSTDRFMKNNHVAGLLVLKNGKIALERYAMGLTSTDRWESFSVTKSITSTLIGAAIEDGAIKSLDDYVTDYIPELKHSAYDGVTIRDLITMTSGVKWREVYTDPDFRRRPLLPTYLWRRHQAGAALSGETAARPRARHRVQLQHRRNVACGISRGPRHGRTSGRLPVGKNLDEDRRPARCGVDDRPARR